MLWAIASDFQCPFWDMWAVDLFLETCSARKVDGVILDGDILDCPQFSDFDRDPRRATRFTHDIERVCNELLKPLHGVKRLIWIDGNHEDRLLKYLVRKAPELLETHPTIPDMLGLDDIGWDYLPYKDYYKLGHLIVTHGQTYRSGVLASVRAEMQRYGGSVLMGHTHRLGMFYHTDLRGPHVGCENGHMSDVNQLTWIKHPDWQQGFSLVKVESNGLFHIQQLPLLGERRSKRVVML